ncbi:MAG: alkaline phosphatase, partial [Pontiella sp.]|nr:alkaline phosphatase [Pontiella sp.]
GGANGMTASNAITAGYSVVSDTNELFALDTDVEAFVSGQFGTYHLPYEANGLDALPHLHQMVQVALDILDNDPDGFFLMLEGSRIDHAGHANDLVRNIHETLEFANAVKTVADWMGDRDDTLIIVTADHETGGLTVTNDNGIGNYPDVTWSTIGHTDTPVPVYATGLNAYLATNVVDNTNIYSLASSPAFVRENLVAMQIDASAVETTWTSSTGDVYSVEQSLNLLSNDWYSISVHTTETFRLTITTTNLPPSDQAFFRLNTIGTAAP